MSAAERFSASGKGVALAGYTLLRNPAEYSAFHRQEKAYHGRKPREYPCLARTRPVKPDKDATTFMGFRWEQEYEYLYREDVAAMGSALERAEEKSAVEVAYPGLTHERGDQSDAH